MGLYFGSHYSHTRAMGRFFGPHYSPRLSINCVSLGWAHTTLERQLSICVLTHWNDIRCVICLESDSTPTLEKGEYSKPPAVGGGEGGSVSISTIVVTAGSVGMQPTHSVSNIRSILTPMLA